LLFSVLESDLFSGDPPDDLVLNCLELGSVFYRERGAKVPVNSAYAVDIDSILYWPSTSDAVEPANGFVWFLTLPIVDQIHILYLDLLGRGADPPGLDPRVAKIVSGSATILDVRDEILESHEFQSRESPAPDQCVGGWCTWSGLQYLAPKVLVPKIVRRGDDSDLGFDRCFLRYLDAVAANDGLSTHLVKLAGIRALNGTEALRSWQSRRVGLIRLIQSRARPNKEAPDPRPHDVARPARSLLSSMEAGWAGIRVGAAIQSKIGVVGDVAYGPYLKLAPGEYETVIELEQLDAPCGESCVICEVRASDILFGITSCHVAAGEPVRAVVHFEVLAESAALLNDLRFEVRISLPAPALIKINTVRLQHRRLTELEETNSFDWLAKLQVGDGGKRLPDWTILSSAERPQSHLVFGPYVKLLPGLYECVAYVESLEDGSERQIIEVEMVSVKSVLKAQRYRLVAEKCQVRFQFEVPDASTSGELIGPLEFRLSRLSPARIKLAGLKVRRVTGIMSYAVTPEAEFVPTVADTKGPPEVVHTKGPPDRRSSIFARLGLLRDSKDAQRTST
jgi:hypothetical protein